MEHWKKGRLAAALSLAVTGCYPVEQAALVYTSKQQFGVTASAGTADSPGMDVNIGYKGLDAAFVPVAVAKRCKDSTGKTCQNRTYQLQTLGGNNDVTSGTSADRGIIEDTKQDLEDKKLQAAGLSKELATVTEALGKIATQPTKAAEKATLDIPVDDAGQPRVLMAAEIERRDTLAKDLQEITTLGPATALEARKATLVVQLKAVNDEIEQLGKTLALQMQQHNLTNGDIKKDSFSLYGSFNGAAGGNSNGANLTLGKLFATGIAAQHIAQEARAQAIANCAAGGDKLLASTPDAQKETEAKKIRAACGFTSD